MKTMGYKRTDKGIVKIENNSNSLEDMFIKAYQKLEIEIKAKRYTFGLDSLQSAILAILERLDDIPEITCQTDAYKYLVKACHNREVDYIRQAMKFDLFSQEDADNNDSGLSDSFVSECLEQIKSILTSDQWSLFTLYHVEGYTQNEIASKLNTYQKDVSRQLEFINFKIESLELKELFDNRYTSYQGHGKRRHLRWPEIVEENGIGYHLDKSSYIPQSKLIPEFIPGNKALQYPTKQYYQVPDDDRTYTALRSGKSNIKWITNLTNGQAKVQSHKGTIEEVK